MNRFVLLIISLLFGISFVNADYYQSGSKKSEVFKKISWKHSSRINMEYSVVAEATSEGVVYGLKIELYDILYEYTDQDIEVANPGRLLIKRNNDSNLELETNYARNIYLTKQENEKHFFKDSFWTNEDYVEIVPPKESIVGKRAIYIFTLTPEELQSIINGNVIKMRVNANPQFSADKKFFDLESDKISSNIKKMYEEVQKEYVKALNESSKGFEDGF